MIYLPHLAKAYARVWLNESATATIAGMLLHSWHPIASAFDATPHCFSRRTKRFNASGYDDSEDDHEDYQRYYDQDVIWRIQFHFWDHHVSRDLTNRDDRRQVGKTNGHLITSIQNNKADDPRQFQLLDVIGDPEVIRHDLTLLRLYV